LFGRMFGPGGRKILKYPGIKEEGTTVHTACRVAGAVDML